MKDLSVLIALSVILMASNVNGASDGTANGIQRKQYAGGADEDDLQVQATLPIPVRTFDGSVPIVSSNGEGSESENPQPPPAND